MRSDVDTTTGAEMFKHFINSMRKRVTVEYRGDAFSLDVTLSDDTARPGVSFTVDAPPSFRIVPDDDAGDGSPWYRVEHANDWCRFRVGFASNRGRPAPCFVLDAGTHWAVTWAVLEPHPHPARLSVAPRRAAGGRA
jgi:hypothetical protein